MSSANPLLSEEEVERQLNDEVIDEASDLVSGLEVRLQQVRAGVLDRETAREMLVRDAHNLKLMARTASIPGLATLTHRLEDYLAGVKQVEDKHIEDLQTFGDRISALLEGDTVAPEQVPEVVRELPSKPTFDVNDIQITNTEVAVVMPQRSAARVIERELQACGYRITTVLHPVEAIELIVESRPDFVITAMVMPTLSGVDLACALSVMPATRDIPVALLTSLDRKHPDLRSLPINTGLVRRGDHFGDDLADVLERFEIT
ncbi:MAG: Hpt domain-containing protein [Kiloniellales bacterium]|nr:Hpt domain-containing protein [Kiloniellales bacterium]